MKRSLIVVAFVVACMTCATSYAQTPGVLYTFDGTGNTRGWFQNFGTNTLSIDNSIAGELTLSETGAAGTDAAFTDGFNSIRDQSVSPADGFFGGLDLTGLDSIEIDFGHSGAGNVDVQFFAQASPGSNFVALGGDVSVTPGVGTYSLPLAPLSAGQQAYIRTIGVNVRDHFGEGNLTWTIEELRSVGTPLDIRDLATHNSGSSDGGLNGVIVNFENSAVAGNDGGQNQTGLAADPISQSLVWTDLANQGGAAIAYGNGTVHNGNGFNERPADLSNYDQVTVRMSAEEATGAVQSLDVQYYLQNGDGFNFNDAGTLALPVDGLFYELTFPVAGFADMDLVMQHGINLADHDGNVVIRVDNVRFSTIPEPCTLALFGLAFAGCFLARRRRFV